MVGNLDIKYIILHESSFLEPPDKIQLDVFDNMATQVLRCRVSGCFPLPIITLVVDDNVVTERKNTTSVNTRIDLKDSAEIKCVVVIPGTNYTDSMKHIYARTRAIARPYTSQGTVWTMRSVVSVWLLALFLV